MNTRIAILAAAAAGLVACGATDEKSCSSREADLAENYGVACTAAPGSTVTIPVRLCAKCSDSSPSCQAEFIGGVIEVAPVFQECQEDAGCAIGPACELRNNSVNCAVAIPGNTPDGSYDIVASTGTVGVLEVTTGPASCQFALTAADFAP